MVSSGGGKKLNSINANMDFVTDIKKKKSWIKKLLDWFPVFRISVVYVCAVGPAAQKFSWACFLEELPCSLFGFNYVVLSVNGTRRFLLRVEQQYELESFWNNFSCIICLVETHKTISRFIICDTTEYIYNWSCLWNL